MSIEEALRKGHDLRERNGSPRPALPSSSAFGTRSVSRGSLMTQTPNEPRADRKTRLVREDRRRQPPGPHRSETERTQTDHGRCQQSSTPARTPPTVARQESFAALLDESLGHTRTASKALCLKGTVVALDSDVAVIDVGLKSEGRVALKRVRRGRQAVPEMKVGDEVEVYLERMENKDGASPPEPRQGQARGGLDPVGEVLRGRASA